jgi:hypothetical protein
MVSFHGMNKWWALIVLPGKVIHHISKLASWVLVAHTYNPSYMGG